jgi:fatty-acyl-CoA synthase
MYDEPSTMGKTEANYQPLTPLRFLERSATTFPEHPAYQYGGGVTVNYLEMYDRTRRLASALSQLGVGYGSTVSVMLNNTPQMLESHYGVPMTGGVLHAINTRLDAPTIAYMLEHGETSVVMVDTEFSDVMTEAINLLVAGGSPAPTVIDVVDTVAAAENGVLLLGERTGCMDYEALLSTGDARYEWVGNVRDEWQAISLNYTSGTTGRPKGVVYHHRGAYLLAMGNVVDATIGKHPKYLWTLPMFHCNGWCFPWSISIEAGTHVCLRRAEATSIFRELSERQVTHLCGAPVVMQMLINAPDVVKQSALPLPRSVDFLTAAAPPPAPVLASMETMGFAVTHVYGLTEIYGPAVINEWHRSWNELDPDKRAALRSRQGVRYSVLEELDVIDPGTMTPTPRDGETIGEVMCKGNVVMKGYLKHAAETDEAFRGGWFHTGDLGVRHADGYVSLKDRSKDIIISGGENISSIEIENVLFSHPAILEAAVVAKSDEKWGETPCAFVTLKPHAQLTEDEVILFCRDNMAHFKCPSSVVFTDLPKTSTGKVQKHVLRSMLA